MLESKSIGTLLLRRNKPPAHTLPPPDDALPSAGLMPSSPLFIPRNPLISSFVGRTSTASTPPAILDCRNGIPLALSRSGPLSLGRRVNIRFGRSGTKVCLYIRFVSRMASTLSAPPICFASCQSSPAYESDAAKSKIPEHSIPAIGLTANRLDRRLQWTEARSNTINHPRQIQPLFGPDLRCTGRNICCRHSQMDTFHHRDCEYCSQCSIVLIHRQHPCSSL